MSRESLKMSRSPAKISQELSIKLPRQALLDLFKVGTITALEKSLQLPDGTLSKAMPENPEYKVRLKRGISARVHKALLEAIAREFSDGEKFRLWMKQHWPDELLVSTGNYLETLFVQVEQSTQKFHMGIFPVDYVVREEESEILDLLMTSKQVQVIWISGVAGSGKSTLAAGIVQRNWDTLLKQYEKILWVNIDLQNDYQDGLRQIGDQLDLIDESISMIEQKLKNLIRKSQILIILDGMQEVSDIQPWKQLIGYLGRLIVTSRVRFMESELRADRQIHQIQLQGFSKKQGHTFLENSGTEIEQATADYFIEQTAGLPLALRLLTGPMLELGIPAEEMRTKLESHRLELYEYPPREDQPRTNLHLCFDLTYGLLQASNPEAAYYFLCSGVFQGNLINRSLLSKTAAAEDGFSEDRWIATLYRLNFVNIEVIRNDRYLRIHPLLHDYARERVRASSHEKEILENYLSVIFSWGEKAGDDFSSGKYSTVLKYHSKDLIFVLSKFVESDEIDRTLKLLMRVFQPLLLNGYLSDVQVALQKLDNLLPQDFPILRLIKMFVFNHLGTIALNGFDEKKASETFEMAYQLGQGMPIEPAWEQMYWFQLGSSILGMGRCWLYASAAQRSLDYLRSPYPVFVFSQIQNEDLQLEKDILLGELLDEAGEFDLALVHFEAALDTCRSAGNSLKMEGVLALQANCYRRMGKLERAIEYYAPVFEDQSQPDSVRIVVGLDFAGCLFERKERTQANRVLNEVEEILEYYRDNDSFIVDFAKLWKYRAFDKHESGDIKEAVECANKSLGYWRKISGTAKEQEQMQTLIEDSQ